LNVKINDIEDKLTKELLEKKSIENQLQLSKDQVQETISKLSKVESKVGELEDKVKNESSQNDILKSDLSTKDEKIRSLNSNLSEKEKEFKKETSRC